MTKRYDVELGEPNISDTINDAYLAGLFDARGSFIICRYIGREQYIYRSQLCICVANEGLIRWLLDNNGGYLQKNKCPPSSRKSMFYWNVSTADQITLCNRILPFLQGKRKECECFMDFRKTFITTGAVKGHKGIKPLPDEITKIRCSLWETSKRLTKERVSNKKHVL